MQSNRSKIAEHDLGRQEDHTAHRVDGEHHELAAAKQLQDMEMERDALRAQLAEDGAAWQRQFDEAQTKINKLAADGAAWQQQLAEANTKTQDLEGLLKDLQQAHAEIGHYRQLVEALMQELQANGAYLTSGMIPKKDSADTSKAEWEAFCRRAGVPASMHECGLGIEKLMRR